MTDIDYDAIEATLAARCMPASGPSELFGKALVPIERETVAALLAEVRRLLPLTTALEPNELAAIRHLVNGTSLPMEMQPARERWVRKLDVLATLLDAALTPEEPS